MSYTKTTWATDDIITAEKLNHAESGIEAASLGAVSIPATLGHDAEITIETALADIVALWNANRRVEIVFEEATAGTIHLPMTGYSVKNDALTVYFGLTIAGTATSGSFVGCAFNNSTTGNISVITWNND